ncbi:hypothetical protein BS78_02G216700 [Paspalum vaginatum]|nr:hypothetical protein BS78_02G216700 [Paspalum vaginatum]
MVGCFSFSCMLSCCRLLCTYVGSHVYCIYMNPSVRPSIKENHRVCFSCFIARVPLEVAALPFGTGICKAEQTAAQALDSGREAALDEEMKEDSGSELQKKHESLASSP